jgi:hypothetical protein
MSIIFSVEDDAGTREHGKCSPSVRKA